MPRLEGTVPLKFGGVVIGRASIIKSDDTGLTVNLFIDNCPGMMDAIIALVEVDQLPSMSFAFDAAYPAIGTENDCAD